MSSLEEAIFKNGSTTYYFSSKFFPPSIREDVFRLYSFVRVADDYVDTIPADVQSFKELRKAWNEAKNDADFNTDRSEKDSLNQRVVKNIVYVSRKYQFDQKWIESFLDSMQADLDKKVYKTIDDTLVYVYGSAEVIGLMMAKIMDLPNDALPYARMQGRAMQFINFIRDIDEDNGLGRCYFPEEELKKFNLTGLQRITTQSNPVNFKNFMNFQLMRYGRWQEEAGAGFTFIPKRLRLPLQTAVDMYGWTAKQIKADPKVVFERKIKPRKRRILVHGLLLAVDIF